MVSRRSDIPRGRYMPVSHSLIVCWRVPICCASSSWLTPRCLRSARTPSLSQTAFRRAITPASYTVPCTGSTGRDGLTLTPYEAAGSHETHPVLQGGSCTIAWPCAHNKRRPDPLSPLGEG